MNRRKTGLRPEPPTLGSLGSPIDHKRGDKSEVFQVPLGSSLDLSDLEKHVRSVVINTNDVEDLKLPKNFAGKAWLISVSDDDVKRRLVQENPYTTFQFDDGEVAGQTITEPLEDESIIVGPTPEETGPSDSEKKEIADINERIKILNKQYGIEIEDFNPESNEYYSIKEQILDQARKMDIYEKAFETISPQEIINKVHFLFEREEDDDLPYPENLRSFIETQMALDELALRIGPDASISSIVKRLELYILKAGPAPHKDYELGDEKSTTEIAEKIKENFNISEDIEIGRLDILSISYGNAAQKAINNLVNGLNKFKKTRNIDPGIKIRITDDQDFEGPGFSPGNKEVTIYAGATPEEIADQLAKAHEGWVTQTDFEDETATVVGPAPEATPTSEQAEELGEKVDQKTKELYEIYGVSIIHTGEVSALKINPEKGVDVFKKIFQQLEELENFITSLENQDSIRGYTAYVKIPDSNYQIEVTPETKFLSISGPDPVPESALLKEWQAYHDQPSVEAGSPYKINSREDIGQVEKNIKEEFSIAMDWPYVEHNASTNIIMLQNVVLNMVQALRTLKSSEGIDPRLKIRIFDGRHTLKEKFNDRQEVHIFGSSDAAAILDIIREAQQSWPPPEVTERQGKISEIEYKLIDQYKNKDKWKLGAQAEGLSISINDDIEVVIKKVQINEDNNHVITYKIFKKVDDKKTEDHSDFPDEITITIEPGKRLSSTEREDVKKELAAIAERIKERAQRLIVEEYEKNKDSLNPENKLRRGKTIYLQYGKEGSHLIYITKLEQLRDGSIKVEYDLIIPLDSPEPAMNSLRWELRHLKEEALEGFINVSDINTKTGEFVIDASPAPAPEDAPSLEKRALVIKDIKDEHGLGGLEVVDAVATKELISMRRAINTALKNIHDDDPDFCSPTKLVIYTPESIPGDRIYKEEGEVRISTEDTADQIYQILSEALKEWGAPEAAPATPEAVDPISPEYDFAQFSLEEISIAFNKEFRSSGISSMLFKNYGLDQEQINQLIKLAREIKDQIPDNVSIVFNSQKSKPNISSYTYAINFPTASSKELILQTIAEAKENSWGTPEIVPSAAHEVISRIIAEHLVDQKLDFLDAWDLRELLMQDMEFDDPRLTFQIRQALKQALKQSITS